MGTSRAGRCFCKSEEECNSTKTQSSWSLCFLLNLFSCSVCWYCDPENILPFLTCSYRGFPDGLTMLREYITGGRITQLPGFHTTTVSWFSQEPQNVKKLSLRGAGSLRGRKGAQSSFTSCFLFMGQGSWEGTQLPRWWAELGDCQGGGLPWWRYSLLVAPSLWEERWRYTGLAGTAEVTGGHLGATAQLAEAGGPSAAEAGSILLPETEGRCFLHQLMCT